MAGEWLKFEANTPEKPEVFAITVAMGWDDPDLTVGKLLKVWRWFDQQTIDGNAANVTLSLLDRISGVSGFAQAMCDVGWLASAEGGLHLPNFERHNGKTAKDRCLTAKRVAKHKNGAGGNDSGNAKGNGDSVSSALPREEKRREEKEVKAEPKAEAPAKTKTATASRLPADWMPSDADIEFCRTERPDLQASDVASRFRDYWCAKSGRDATKTNWPATWRNWVRNERRRQSCGPPGYQTPNEKAKDFADRLTGKKRHEPSHQIIDLNEPPS